MAVRTVKLIDYGIVTRKEIVLYHSEVAVGADSVFTELGIRDLLNDSDGGTAGALVSPLEVAVCRMATHESKFLAMTRDMAMYRSMPIHEAAFSFLRNLLNICKEYPSAIVLSKV